MTEDDFKELLEACKQACRAFERIAEACDDPPKAMFRAWERCEETICRVEGEVDV